VDLDAFTAMPRPDDILPFFFFFFITLKPRVE